MRYQPWVVVIVALYGLLSGGTSAQAIESIELVLRRTIGRGIIMDVAFSPNDRHMAVATPTGVYLHLLADLTAEPQHLIKDVVAERVAFDPEGARLFVLTDDAVATYNIRGQPLANTDAHEFPPLAAQTAARSMSGRYEATWWSKDGTLNVGGTAVHGYSAEWWGTGISPDEHLMMVTAWPRDFTIWNLEMGEQVALCDGCVEWTDHIEAYFWPDSGHILIAGIEQSVLTDTTFQPNVMVEYAEPGYPIVTRTAGVLGVIHSARRAIDFYSFDGWRQVGRIELSQQEFQASVISPRGTWFAASVRNVGDPARQSLQIWHIETGTLVHTRKFDDIYQLIFSPDQRWLAAARQRYGEFEIEIYDTATWTRMHTLRMPEGAGIPSFAFNADGSLLAMAYDNAVSLADTSNWQQLAAMPLPEAFGGQWLGFDGDMLIVSHFFGFARIYSIIRA